jgi:ribulose-phosphate 3-epimerase
MTTNIFPELSCSVISGNPLSFTKDITLLEQGGINSFHFDVMDGVFVPRLGLYPEYLRMLSGLTNLPIEVHLMMENPELFIEEFINAGSTRLIPHIESLKHPVRTMMKIQEKGAKSGIALNPGTHISVVEPLLDYIDSVMLMAINPGIVGHKLLSSTFQRLGQLRELLGWETDIKIIVDGGVTFENASELLEAGANSIVCGAGTVFKDQSRIFENTIELRKLCNGQENS